MDAVVYRGGSANRASVRGFVQHVNEPEDRQEEIDTVAAAWAARLGGGRLSDAERRALDRWLGESPAHAAAFDEAQSAWRKMGELRAAPGALAEDIVAAGQTVGRAARPPVQRAGGRGIWPPAAALAACLLLVAMGAVWLGDPVALLMADHSTAPGAHQRVALSDGSSVELGPASAIALHFTDDERRVELLSGQAYFVAASMNGSERRPFVVEAGNGASRALGTRFMVERLADTVEVVVVEHDVEVALSGADVEPQSAVLSGGRAVRYAAAGLQAVRRVDLERATAWRRGRLIFDRRPLGEVVAELNRYRHGRIVIADPSLASRTVSGVFDTVDPEAALATIARDLRIRSAALPPLVTLLY